MVQKHFTYGICSFRKLIVRYVLLILKNSDENPAIVKLAKRSGLKIELPKRTAQSRRKVNGPGQAE